eukprot:TRINITY_DN23561_c0_g3_i1.p1 TRINITY_DN23561_c0_g3~~TRINITY_DN23561_c0_g3_i1.p1  ORF type:complete len:576 (-),score=70.69 TRINITY_DN23561_c0_g3_i1:624-2294(-)
MPIARLMRRPLAKGAAGVLSIGVGGAAYGYLTDEGFQRMVDFNRLVLPIALHYKFVQYRVQGLNDEAQAAAYEPLHQKYAPRSLDISLRMRGFYIKLGQVASNIGRTSLPDVYTDTLKVLQEDCPSQPFTIVRQIVESELGTPLEDIFESFSPEPLAAASVGQVHSATLLGGKRVVVKVQHLDAEHNFRTDVMQFIRASRVLFPEWTNVLAEIEKNFATEFDFTREAHLQRRAAEALKGLPRVVVPLPVDSLHPACPASKSSGLCTKRVLVMDLLDGVSLQKWSNVNLRRIAAQQGKTEDEFLKSLQTMSTDELKGMRPSRFALWSYKTFLRARDALFNSPAFLYNSTIGFLTGKARSYRFEPQPLDIYEVADIILEAQARCIFGTGFVNGDPHPGNIMLLNSGKVGLIDWGQVREYSADERCVAARLLISLAEKDEILTAQCLRDMGHVSERNLDWSAYKVAAVWFGSFSEADELGGLALFEENMDKIDRRVQPAAKYITLIYNFVHIRQAVALLGFPELNSAETHRHAASACLRREGRAFPATVPGRKAERPEF